MRRDINEQKRRDTVKLVVEIRKIQSRLSKIWDDVDPEIREERDDLVLKMDYLFDKAVRLGVAEEVSMLIPQLDEEEAIVAIGAHLRFLKAVGDDALISNMSTFLDETYDTLKELSSGTVSDFDKKTRERYLITILSQNDQNNPE